MLADYIGIAVEGFSGGGGAVVNRLLSAFKSIQIFNFIQDNNGIFFGNFLGTLLGSLSAVKAENF